jgi:hypothetical protein
MRQSRVTEGAREERGALETLGLSLGAPVAHQPRQNGLTCNGSRKEDAAGRRDLWVADPHVGLTCG